MPKILVKSALLFSCILLANSYCSEKKRDVIKIKSPGFNIGYRTLIGLPLSISCAAFGIYGAALAYDYWKPKQLIQINNNFKPEVNVGYRTLIGIPLGFAFMTATYFGLRLWYNRLNWKTQKSE